MDIDHKAIVCKFDVVEGNNLSRLDKGHGSGIVIVAGAAVDHFT